MPLIDAYLARRALDYLVGYTLSPLLWRKLPGSRSAGRVQSVALRLICEREAEIEAFRPREYWTIDGLLATASGQNLQARLVELDGGEIELRGRDAVDEHRTTAGESEPEQQLDERRLAAAGRTDDPDRLAPPEHGRHVGQRGGAFAWI